MTGKTLAPVSLAVRLSGCCSVYLGERIVEPGTARTVLSAVGAGAGRRRRSPALRCGRAGRRPIASSVEQALLGALRCVGVAAAAALLPPVGPLGSSTATGPRASGAQAGGGAGGAVAGADRARAAARCCWSELSYAAMAPRAAARGGRVRDALLSGLGLAGALVFAFSSTYVAPSATRSSDFSYFRTATPGRGDARRSCRRWTSRSQVSIFFPPANEVRRRGRRATSTDLQGESPKLEVEQLRPGLDPAKARELGVSGNGILVVVAAATRKETARRSAWSSSGARPAAKTWTRRCRSACSRWPSRSAPSTSPPATASAPTSAGDDDRQARHHARPQARAATATELRGPRTRRGRGPGRRGAQGRGGGADHRAAASRSSPRRRRR